MIASLRKKITNKIKTSHPFDELVGKFAYDKFPISLEGIKGGMTSFLLSEISSINKGSLLVVVQNEKEAENLISDLETIGETPVLMPQRDKIAYSTRQPDIHLEGKRLVALKTLCYNPEKIVVTTVGNMMQPIIPKTEFLKLLLSLKKGMEINPLHIKNRLTQLGYMRVPRVSIVGEFSLKGEVLDLFIPGSELPIRIIYEWDTIEQIKEFDLLTFSSVTDLDEILITPATEAVWTDERIQHLSNFIKKRPLLLKESSQFLPMLKEGIEIANSHLFYQLSFQFLK